MAYVPEFGKNGTAPLANSVTKPCDPSQAGFDGRQWPSESES